MIIEAMNLMGYDAMALGERDLQLGVDQLQLRMSEADLAVVSANVHLAETGELFAAPYTILKSDDRSFGIIGLTGMPAELPPGFTISDPIKAVEDLLPEVTEGADLIIILSHLGWNQSKQLADLDPEIDLVISGGMDTPDPELYQGPLIGTYLAQAELPSSRHAGRRVGRWKLTLDTANELTLNSWTIISLGPEFIDAPVMVDLVRRYRSQLQ